MKKAILKKLSLIASELPELTETVRLPAQTGEELKKRGITMLEGRPVEPKDYHKGGTAQQAINHLSRIVAAYQRGGEVAVAQYAAEVHRRHSKKMEEQRAAQKKKEAEKVI
jgi:hypothetical protein